MPRARQLLLFALALFVTSSVFAQGKARSHRPTHHPKPKLPTWTYNITLDGYLVRGQDSYFNPTFTADQKWFHAEARYESEYIDTGSLWIGQDFQWGKTLSFAVTPVVGGVFGATHGVGPGLEATATYKKIELSFSSEYIFNTDSKSDNFYSGWLQLTYSPRGWFRLGFASQTNKPYQQNLDFQPGFFLGVAHKNFEFTTYAFNTGQADASVVLELGCSF